MKFIIFATLLAFVAARENKDQQKKDREDFVSHFCERLNRSYCGSNGDEKEFESRFKAYLENKQFAQTHNSKQSSFSLSENSPFGDMTNEEFRLTKFASPPKFGQHHVEKTVRRQSLLGPAQVVELKNDTLPDSVNWLEKNAVTSVKNQQSCGSCYAFSALGAVEGVVALKTGKLISLSEQEIVDCDRVDHGCHGGLMPYVFEYIIRNKGVCSAKSYPYNGHGGRCRAHPTFFHHDQCIHISSITGYHEVKSNDEHDLQRAVAQQPVSVAICASDRLFQLYSSGVFDAPCGLGLDHGVLAVGYGTTADGKDYWMVKNSWSESWGDEGYIRMARNVPGRSGQCGIAMQASYPVIEDED